MTIPWRTWTRVDLTRHAGVRSIIVLDVEWIADSGAVRGVVGDRTLLDDQHGGRPR